MNERTRLYVLLVLDDFSHNNGGFYNDASRQRPTYKTCWVACFFKPLSACVHHSRPSKPCQDDRILEINNPLRPIRRSFASGAPPYNTISCGVSRLTNPWSYGAAHLTQVRDPGSQDTRPRLLSILSTRDMQWLLRCSRFLGSCPRPPHEADHAVGQGKWRSVSNMLWVSLKALVGFSAGHMQATQTHQMS
jgi:hypothetical protein